jgi:hypothetical protein
MRREVLAPGGSILLLQTLVPEAGDRAHNSCEDGVAPGGAELLAARSSYTCPTKEMQPQRFLIQFSSVLLHTEVCSCKGVRVWCRLTVLQLAVASTALALLPKQTAECT